MPRAPLSIISRCVPCSLVYRLQHYISLTLYRQQAILRGVEDATQLLALLVEANDAAGARAADGAAPLDVSAFYNVRAP